MFEKKLGEKSLAISRIEYQKINEFIEESTEHFINRMNREFNLDIKFSDLLTKHQTENPENSFGNHPQSLDKLFSNAKFYKILRDAYAKLFYKNKDQKNFQLFKLYYDAFIARKNVGITKFVDDKLKVLTERQAVKDKKNKYTKLYLATLFIVHNIVLFCTLGPIANAIYCGLALLPLAKVLLGKQSKFYISKSSDKGTLDKYSSLAEKSYAKAKSKYEQKKTELKGFKKQLAEHITPPEKHTKYGRLYEASKNPPQLLAANNNHCDIPLSKQSI